MKLLHARPNGKALARIEKRARRATRRNWHRRSTPFHRETFHVKHPSASRRTSSRVRRASPERSGRHHAPPRTTSRRGRNARSPRPLPQARGPPRHQRNFARRADPAQTKDGLPWTRASPPNQGRRARSSARMAPACAARLAHATVRLRARPLVRARRPRVARGSPARQPARWRSSSTCYRAPPARHAVHPLVRSSARAAPRAPRGSPTRACRPRAPRVIARRLHRRSRPLHRRRTRRRSRRHSKSPRSQRTAPTGRWPRCS